MKKSVRKQGGSQKISEMSVFLSNISDGREVSWLLSRLSQRTNRSKQKKKRNVRKVRQMSEFKEYVMREGCERVWI